MKIRYAIPRFRFSFLVLAMLMTSIAFASNAKELVIDNEAKMLVASEGCSYQWFKNGELLEGETENQLGNIESGEYAVQIMDEVGNVSVQSATVAVSATGAIIRIYTIGDSTVSTYSASEYPRTGWGQVLQSFFASANVQVINKAQSGASSKSFYTSYWTAVKNVLQAGDFVFIQFGHNDSKNTTQDDIDNRYTAPQTTYKQYLTSYINETKAKGAFPVLVTSMNRNWWKSGAITPLADYPPAMRELATALKIPLIDLTAKSATLFNSLGQPYITNFIFNNLEVGEYANYPEGNADNTHFQEMGAIEMARLVAQGILELSADVNVKTLIPFIKTQYQIAVSANPATGSDSMTTRTASYPQGLTVTLKTVPKTGKTFQKWNNTSSAQIATSKITSFTSGTTATSYTAIYKGAVTVVVDCNNTTNGTAILDNCGRCILGMTGKTACSSVGEAETDACAFDGITETKNTGYKGTSYLNVDNAVGTAITFNITATNAGSATLSFRYSNGGTIDRPAQISLNGTVLATNLSFPVTGTFTDWKAVDISLSLLKGNNVLKVISATAEGLPNIDQIGYVSSDVSKGSCVITEITNLELETLNYEVFPNPSTNQFTIQSKGEFKYQLLDLKGFVLNSGEAPNTKSIGEELPQGIYLLKIENASGKRVVKIVKN